MTTADSTSLSPMQKRFCEEYLLDLNGKQAAIRAGYAAKTAEVQASRLLRNVKVQRRVEELKSKRSQRTNLDGDYVLTRLQTVVDRCMQEAPVMRAGKPVMISTPSGALAAAYTFDAVGATRALDLLGRHIGLFEKDNKQRGGAGLTTEELIRMLDEREGRDREDRVKRVDAEIEEMMTRERTQH
jgi:phage terminase small subunit